MTVNGIPLHPLVVHAAVVLVPLAALVLIAWWSLPHHNPLPDKEHRRGVTTLAKPLVVLLPLAAAVTLVLVVLTGDAGARAVWGSGGRNGAEPATTSLVR